MFFQDNAKGSMTETRLLLEDCILADVVNQQLIHNTCVLIENGIIKRIGVSAGFSIEPELRRISLAGKTLVPGLIDAHVHLCLSALSDCHITLNSLDSEQLTEIVRENLLKNLMAGITTVRDLGSPMSMLSILRELDSSMTTFPSVMASGPVLTTEDGHATFIGVAANASNAAELIKSAASEGAELVKLVGTGGNLSPNTDTHGCQYSDEDFSGIVQEAQAAGFSVACHVHAAAAADQCLRFGVRSIEHGSYIKVEQLPEFIKAGAYWVPTICPGRLVNGLSEAALDRVARRRSNLRHAINLGLNIAAGTDAGIGGVKHGCLAHELDEFMDGGMTPLQALRTATFQNAVMMGIEEKKGSLETGKDADILVFDGDISAPGFSFHNPELIIKAGALVKGSF